MTQPIVLKGVVKGRTIILDDDSFLPEGYPVTLQLIITPEEAARLAIGGWSDLTAEGLSDLEGMLSDLRGRPVSLPSAGQS